MRGVTKPRAAFQHADPLRSGESLFGRELCALFDAVLQNPLRAPD